jgi:murein DD-endopeptidase MepM/ murein hydrolase activator NlpD
MKTPEQIQFQGSATAKGFQPLDFGSAVPAYQQYGEQQSNALRKAQELEGRNLDAVGQYNASRAGQDLKDLARFSETLSGVLMTEAKKQNERDQEEGLNMAYMDGFSAEQVAEFDAKEAELRLADEGIQSYADAVAKQGAPFMGVQKVRELSGWKAYGYAMGMAQMAGQGYSDAMAQALASLPPGASVAEKSAALATARGRYMTQTGLVGMNPMLSNKYAFPMMREVDAKLISGWRQQEQKEAQQLMRDEAMQPFSADPVGTFGQTIMALERSGMSKGEARDFLLKQIQDPNVILAIGATPSWDGKQTWAEKYPFVFRDAHDTAMKANQARFSMYETEVEQDKKNTLNGIMQELSGRDNVTDQEVDKILEGYQQRYGTSEIPPELANYKANLTLQARDKKEQEDVLTTMVAARTLTTAELMSGKYSKDLVIKYMSTAQGIDKDFEAGGAAAKASTYQIKAVENAIKLKLGKKTTDELTNPSGQLAMGSAVSSMEALAKQLKAANPTMSWNEAYESAAREIIKDIEDPNSKKWALKPGFQGEAGFANFGANATSKQSVINLKQKQQVWARQAATEAVFTREGGAFSTEEVKQLAKSGEGNLSKLSIITTMYNQKNPKNPITLDGARQLLLKNYGVSAAQNFKAEPDSYEQVALSSNMISLLTRPTPSRLNRVSAQGALIPAKIRQGTAGAGDVIQTAIAVGMPPQIAPLAAVQWALESGWGKYQSGKNNVFGIKGAGTTVQTQEDYGNGMVTVNASFRDYNSPHESIRDYVQLMQDPRYAAVQQARTPAEALRAVKAAGYATDPAYVSKGLAIFKQMGIDPNVPYNPQPLTSSPWSNPALMGTAAKKFITGNTGIGTGAHLDMRVYDPVAGDYIDPTGYQDALTVDGGIPIRRKFALTSGYGPRRAPVPGASTFHKGLDFGTPEGTAISVRGGRFLRSWWDDGGGGVVTAYRLPDGKELRLLHGSKQNLRS